MCLISGLIKTEGGGENPFNFNKLHLKRGVTWLILICRFPVHKKTDEFYTQLSTIEDELKHYKKYFKDKIVFCNADDPAGGEDGSDHFGDGQGRIYQ